jgi:hypothetical protein
LSKLREKRASRALMTEARQLKAAYQFHGLKPPDWLRGFRATPVSKVRCHNRSQKPAKSLIKTNRDVSKLSEKGVLEKKIRGGEPRKVIHGHFLTA